MKKPNFFIVGAPKCGTTALSEYLRGHPNVFFSQPKDTGFFATDFPGGRVITRFEDYMALFNEVQPNHLRVGEGSVWYLYSREAVRNIYEYNPEAKLLVMLRNPVDLVHSLHSQLLLSIDEDEKDFERAWNLQELRKSGKRIPKKCRTPAMLQYRDVGKLGVQMERLLEVFPKEQVKVILFENFVSDTKAVYEDVLSFLGLNSDGRKLFPRVNETSKYRSQLVGHFTQTPPDSIIHVWKYIKDTFGINDFGHRVMNRLRQANTVIRPRTALNGRLRLMLIHEFEEDIYSLESIIGRNLSHWVNK
ncbi:MAG: sulfotransferase family protein [Dissulfuribacterales bacterium]